jgi:hypothetical protein
MTAVLESESEIGGCMRVELRQIHARAVAVAVDRGDIVIAP